MDAAERTGHGESRNSRKAPIVWPRVRGGAKQAPPYARPQERPRLGSKAQRRGAEGATAPETLRQKDCGRKGALESGGAGRCCWMLPGRTPKE
jgi:hypothetical protein